MIGQVQFFSGELTKTWIVALAFSLQVAVLLCLHRLGQIGARGRRDERNRINSPESTQYAAFESLAFYELPRGTLEKWSPLLHYRGDSVFPAEGLGDRRPEYVENIMWMILHLGEAINLFRCSNADESHLLLLVDNRVGFGRHVWCILDITRPASGRDLSVKVHSIVPRHLDIFDWTLIRYLRIPVVFVLSFLTAIDNPQQRGSEALKNVANPMGVFVLGAAILIGTVVGILFRIQAGLIAFGSAFVLGSIVEAVVTAQEPLPDMERCAIDLQQLVMQAVHTATMEMPQA
jgi:hypothetical protein